MFLFFGAGLVLEGFLGLLVAFGLGAGGSEFVGALGSF